MLYHAVRAVHRGYALTLFWLYLGLFGVAFLCIFVFPPATLALLFVGIFGLVAAYMGGVLLGMTENALARSALRRDTCPRCGSAMGRRSEGRTRAPSASDQTCRTCGARFESSGSELEPLGLEPQELEPVMGPRADIEPTMTLSPLPNVSSPPQEGGPVKDQAAS